MTGETNLQQSHAQQASTVEWRASARTAEDREDCRYPVHQLLWVVRPDGSRSSATMVDVSRLGFGLKVSRPPTSGERVLLSGGLSDIPGEIRWSSDDRAGGVFLRPDDL